MWIATLALGAALAAEPEPETVLEPIVLDSTWVDRYERSRKTYTTGMVMGVGGTALLVTGLGTMIGASDRFPFEQPEYATGVAAVAIGAVLLEVGAPLALGGSRRGCRATQEMLPARGSRRCIADTGWGLYAAQTFLLPFVLPGAYAIAAVQAGNNKAAFPTEPPSRWAAESAPLKRTPTVQWTVRF